LSEVTTVFGPADEEFPAGERIETSEEDGQPGKMIFYRSLTYKNLSETASIHVRVYPDERVGFSFRGKFLGKPPRAAQS
jgi:hypothetical protein